MNNKWYENLISIPKYGRTCVCPFCGMNKVRFKRTQIDKNTCVGYMDLWCDNCRNAYHVSRMKITVETDDIIIPKNLKY